jgi:hypothetical protein
MSSSNTFGNALAFAAQLHGEQTRKGSDTPYISHLLAVTAIALDHGATEDEAIAAVLHDAVEDQGAKRRWRRFAAALAIRSPASSQRARTRTSRRNHPGGSGKRRMSHDSGPSRIRSGWS